MPIGLKSKQSSTPLGAPTVATAITNSAASVQVSADSCVVPPAGRDPMLQEVSGEPALHHVQLLAANRIRPLEEYTGTVVDACHVRDMRQSTEIPWLIDGTRSMLGVYKLIRAKYGDLATSSAEWKFAYVVTADTPDIDPESIAANILAMEQVCWWR
jgi:hypothetical protein